MAHLARCPRCYCELELPPELVAGDQAWATCPSCDESFAVADAKPREIKVAAACQPPAEHAEDQATQPTADLAADFGSATLASYLGDDAAKELDAREQRSKSSAATISDLPSLEDLFRSTSPRPTEPEPPQATVEPEEAAEPVAPTPSEVDRTPSEVDQTASDDKEPSPAADRLRGMRGDDFPIAAAGESGEYDTVDDVDATDEADDESTALALGEFATLGGLGMPTAHADLDSSAPDSEIDDHQTRDDQVAATVADAPAFDFEVGDDPLSESKSLRAAMGLASDEPLQLHDEPDEPVGQIDTGESSDHSESLDFDVPETPRGVVASRKRSSSLSMLRTVLGVVFGGVLGIAGGYLILLWILDFRGVTDDPLSLAGYYPDVVKPESFQSTPSPPAQRPQADRLASSEGDTSDDVGAMPSFDDSSEVDQATYESELGGEGDRVPERWKFPASPAQQDSEQPAAPPEVELTGVPTYTAGELQELITAAEQASPALTAGGDIDKSKGSSYATLAKLAEVLTFADANPDAEIKQQARSVFPPLFTGDETRRQIAQIAGYWLNSPKRHHGGIFFSGSVDPGRQQGSVAEYNFTLRTGQQLTVLTPEALTQRVSSASSIAVVGSVVDDPAAHIPGYTGSATQAVWSTSILPLGE